MAMEFDSNTSVLRRVPLFSELAPQQLSIIAFTSSWRSFMPREAIIQRGQTGTSAYVILTGQAVAVGPEGSEEFERLGPGSLLGEVAMLCETTYRSTVIAERGVGTIVITHETMRKILRRDPTIGQLLAHRIAGRIGALTASLDALGRNLAMADTALPPAPVSPAT